MPSSYRPVDGVVIVVFTCLTGGVAPADPDPEQNPTTLGGRCQIADTAEATLSLRPYGLLQEGERGADQEGG